MFIDQYLYKITIMLYKYNYYKLKVMKHLEMSLIDII